ncbi:uncharacterized protein [Miscanthus floridulus]|uniref:uncharacterized protein isoform X5 n=1 Tax=Miscanthus floridulus TaxID=154761 RepID=UPI0034582EC4
MAWGIKSSCFQLREDADIFGMLHDGQAAFCCPADERKAKETGHNGLSAAQVHSSIKYGYIFQSNNFRDFRSTLYQQDA